MALALDPMDRFRQVTSGVAPSALDPDELVKVIDASDGKEIDALADYIGQQTPWTAEQAKPIIKEAVKDKPDAAAKATAVNNAMTSVAPGVDVELVDPVMLQPWARAVTGLLLLVVVGACVVLIADLEDNNASITGLTFIAVFALIGVLVLVMGYKNVKIKASPSGDS